MLLLLTCNALGVSFLKTGMDTIGDQSIRAAAHVRCYGDRINREVRLLLNVCSSLHIYFVIREFAFPQLGSISILVQQGAKPLFTFFNITKKTPKRRVSVSWPFSRVGTHSSVPNVGCRVELLADAVPAANTRVQPDSGLFLSKQTEVEFRVLSLNVRLFFHCSDDGGVQSSPRALLRLHAQRHPSHGLQPPDGAAGGGPGGRSCGALQLLGPLLPREGGAASVGGGWARRENASW